MEEPRLPRPISFLGAALWTSATGFLAILAVHLTDEARPGASLDVVNITACIVLAYSLLIFAMLRVYSPDASVREVLGIRAASPVGTFFAGLSGGALCVALSFVDAIMAKRFPMSEEDAERVESVLRMTTWGERVVVLAASVVVIPIFEELFFRGVLFSGLRRGRPEGLTVLGAAAFYALSRADPRALPAALGFGLLASWLRGRSGSLVPAVLASAVYQAVDILPLALGKTDFEVTGKMAAGAAAATAASAALAIWMFSRDARAERGRLLDA